MIKWIKKLRMIVSTYGQLIMELEEVQREMEKALHFIKRATKLHVDIPASQKNATTVILIGRYRGKDHVRTFNLHPNDMDHLVGMLKHMSERAVVEHIDAPFEIDATVRRALL